MHCCRPGCLESVPGAGRDRQYSNGIVDFPRRTDRCGLLITGCQFQHPAASPARFTRLQVHLCSDRVEVGARAGLHKPAHGRLLVFGTKEEMQQHAAERVGNLLVTRL